MGCRKCENRIMRYFDGTAGETGTETRSGNLKSRELKSIREHIDSCPRCRALFDDLNKIFGTMNQMKETAAETAANDQAFERSVMARIALMPEQGTGTEVAAESFTRALNGTLSMMAILLGASAVLMLYDTSITALLSGAIRSIAAMAETVRYIHATYNIFSLFFSGFVSTVNIVLLAMCVIAGAVVTYMLFMTPNHPWANAGKQKN